jgi:hypothetical protein
LKPIIALLGWFEIGKYNPVLARYQIQFREQGDEDSHTWNQARVVHDHSGRGDLIGTRCRRTYLGHQIGRQVRGREPA